MDLKYGDVLITKGIWIRQSKLNGIAYRFRIDPVPNIHKFTGSFRSFYKNPAVMQEQKLFFEHKKYVRGKRTIKNLPDSWDDRQRGDIKTRHSWKSKKIKKQWMKNI